MSALSRDFPWTIFLSTCLFLDSSFCLIFFVHLSLSLDISFPSLTFLFPLDISFSLLASPFPSWHVFFPLDISFSLLTSLFPSWHLRLLTYLSVLISFSWHFFSEGPSLDFCFSWHSFLFKFLFSRHLFPCHYFLLTFTSLCLHHFSLKSLSLYVSFSWHCFALTPLTSQWHAKNHLDTEIGTAIWAPTTIPRRQAQKVRFSSAFEKELYARLQNLRKTSPNKHIDPASGLRGATAGLRNTKAAAHRHATLAQQGFNAGATTRLQTAMAPCAQQLFNCTLFYSPLLSSPLLCSILFFSILFYSIPFCSVLLYPMLFYSILFCSNSILLYSTFLYALLCSFALLYSLLSTLCSLYSALSTLYSLLSTFYSIPLHCTQVSFPGMLSSLQRGRSSWTACKEKAESKAPPQGQPLALRRFCGEIGTLVVIQRYLAKT